ncbi:MAG: MogA/MoaB family molybdenum cofactor biosynthesis protein [Acidobacteria bacterium]|nr:MogA/MoaB family molybdenum cofactor biosynthesis protein [Acidobacteriota bacterium]
MLRARVITCSDAASRGEREDRSGPALREALGRLGFAVDRVEVVPDEEERIAAAVVGAVDRDGIRLVVTTGGTGISPRDVTPEALARIAHKRLEGFGELMRLRSLEKTTMAPLSRAQAVTRGRALILSVPGSPAGAVENLEAVAHLISHALELLAGAPVESHPE